MKIIIPAYQPDHRMLKLINDIKTNSDHDIIIVNDGSSDTCRRIFEKAEAAGCIVLHHKENQGKGAALKTAFQYLKDNHCMEGLVCADCDGQHTWTDINKLADELLLHTNTILLGCRKFVGKVPFKSMFGNRLTRGIFSIITGTKISDTQTGLRAFSADMLPWLVQLKGNRYEYEMNQLLEAKKAGFGFFCIPIETIYENNNEGSHFNPVLDSIRIYLPIIKFSMSSLICGAIDFVLLFLLKGIFNNLFLAVAGARIASSLCNYGLNKNLVFSSTKKKSTTLIQYYLLVAVILFLNYLLLSLLHETLHAPLLISKILTEVILFGFSYTVQHYLIFKKA